MCVCVPLFGLKAVWLVLAIMAKVGPGKSDNGEHIRIFRAGGKNCAARLKHADSMTIKELSVVPRRPPTRPVEGKADYRPHAAAREKMQ
jgi:hypothetical protein